MYEQIVNIFNQNLKINASINYLRQGLIIQNVLKTKELKRSYSNVNNLAFKRFTLTTNSLTNNLIYSNKLKNDINSYMCINNSNQIKNNEFLNTFLNKKNYSTSTENSNENDNKKKVKMDKKQKKKRERENYESSTPFISFFFFMIGLTSGAVCANKIFEKFESKRQAVLLKDAPNELTTEEIDKMLKKNEDIEKLPKCIVDSYETNFINSNNPIEDQHTQSIYNNKLIFGVYDGHSGTQCGKVVAKNLHHYLAKYLSKLSSSNANKKEKVIEALKKSFCELDKDIINGAVQLSDDDEGFSEESTKLTEETVKEQIKSALSGSCALVSMIDIDTNDLYVACTGDSRAVLGRKEVVNDKSQYAAIPLSVDQTLRNEKEKERMEREHPGEKDTLCIKNRVLGGLMPTRTFGDARYKWSNKIQKALVKPKYISRRPLPFYYTPPYVTAEPEVIHHKLDSSDAFLVMATDGIWDVLSNEDVVNLVGQHMENKKKNKTREVSITTPDSLLIETKQKLTTNTSNKNENLNNVQLSQNSSTTSNNSLVDNNLTISIRHVPAIFKDKNAATHVIRNALGGSDEKYISKLLSIPSPTCRQHRDDMTVTIIYFNNEVLSSNSELSNVTSEKNKSYIENIEIKNGFVPAIPSRVNSNGKKRINDWINFTNKK